MRDRQSQRNVPAGAASESGDRSPTLFAVYGSLALIAAIVIGTLPYRPF